MPIYSLKQSKGMILDFDSGLRMQRSYQLFKNAINSEKTLQKYDSGLTKFMNHFGYDDYDSILSDDIDTIQRNLEDYVNYYPILHNAPIDSLFERHTHHI